MRQSQLFTKTRKDAPKDEVSQNAGLLIRAGFVHKDMAGVYSYLPLGLRVLRRIESIIRKEMEESGGQEVYLSSLQDRRLWEATDRWSDEKVDNWFKTKLKNDTELGLATTHEEPLTNLLVEHMTSYRDLPRAIYQFQTKFRNELRSKSGLMRGREFLMKDCYSFAKDEKEHEEFYRRMSSAYKAIFEEVGIGDRTYFTYASGGSFSKYSHEFQTVTPAGEDTIHRCKKCNVAVNEEIIHEQSTCPECNSSDLTTETAVEVGNIFSLGTRFSKALGLMYRDESGNLVPVVMGSYGIGVGRLLGTIVETHADDRGIVWPETVAPFMVHLLVLAQGEGEGVHTEAEKLYLNLTREGVPVLYDDRMVTAGEKFADADLIGIPFRVVVSEKTIKAGGIEFKKRTEEEVSIIGEDDLNLRLHEKMVRPR